MGCPPITGIVMMEEDTVTVVRMTKILVIRYFHIGDAEYVLIAYGSSARPALHVIDHLRKRGQRIGLLELNNQ